MTLSGYPMTPQYSNLWTLLIEEKVEIFSIDTATVHFSFSGFLTSELHANCHFCSRTADTFPDTFTPSYVSQAMVRWQWSASCHLFVPVASQTTGVIWPKSREFLKELCRRVRLRSQTIQKGNSIVGGLHDSVMTHSECSLSYLLLLFIFPNITDVS